MESKVDKEDLIRIKGLFAQKYGIQLDDWSACLFQEMQDNLKPIHSDIIKASSSIKGQVSQVSFQSNKEAFYYGLGHLLVPSVTFFILALYGIYFHSKKEDLSEIQRLVNANKGIEKLIQIYPELKTEVINGYEYLVFYPYSKKHDLFGQFYEFDKKNKRVLIPFRTN